MTNPFENNDSAYLVLVNEEGQHSLWPTDLDVPEGWTGSFGPAPRQDCLDYVDATWTALTPERV
jgi:MbtH protein